MKDTIWRHKKTQGFYRVLSLSRLQTNWPSTRLNDMEVMVVYQSLKDSTTWVRSEAEFRDGRFERIYYQNMRALLNTIERGDLDLAVAALKERGTVAPE